MGGMMARKWRCKEERMRVLWLALGLIAAAIPAARADSALLDEIIARGTLKVGMTGDYKPFSEKSKTSGAYEGLDVDMAEALAKALGVKLEIVPTAWGKMLADLEAGAFDIAVGGVSITLDRQKKAYFSTPLLRDGKTPIARCVDKERFAEIKDIDKPEVRVVVNPGGTNERFARANIKTAPIRVHPDNTTIFDEIVQGRADVMITDAVETRLQQKLRPELCALHPDKPFDFSEKAYMMRRDYALKLFVDQWLHQMRETGAYAKLFSKWVE